MIRSNTVIKKIKYKGSITLYDLKMNFIQSHLYNSFYKRRAIIKKLGKRYPNKHYYLVISPNDISIPQKHLQHELED